MRSERMSGLESNEEDGCGTRQAFWSILLEQLDVKTHLCLLVIKLGMLAQPLLERGTTSSSSDRRQGVWALDNEERKATDTLKANEMFRGSQRR